MESGFDGIFLIVSNPVDIITHYVKKLSGLPKNQVIGTGTAIDSARLKTFIGELINVDPRSVHAYSMGEHGDSSMVPFSHVYFGGKSYDDMCKENPDTLGSISKEEIMEEVRRGGFKMLTLMSLSIRPQERAGRFLSAREQHTTELLQP